ncbi:hypothetical protein V5738_10895 [Salinisphaera sp. SPP-AMP-43]|uniref:hypothetical protein n=1 Tax=Salinisphaera sp. SPP-AMP-43 TaxID=3121288 RepID=UPI003C6E0D27
MIKPDAQVAKSLATLKNTPEFQPVREWIAQSLSDVDRKLRTGEGTHLARLQGEAQCLESLIERVDNSRETAEKLSR